VVLGVPAVLLIVDVLSTREPTERLGIRVVTANVATAPNEVAQSLRPLKPDVVFMQETGATCADAGRSLGLLVYDGSDQCVLSRWPVTASSVTWAGPWQPPQILSAEHPEVGRLTLVNVRLPLPYAIAKLSGNAWYTPAQRRDQYSMLRDLLSDKDRILLCGDLNAFPFEVDLGPGFRDMWSRRAYGGTFPAWLPAARIDQCWSNLAVDATTSWTRSILSDHRAVVVDITVQRAVSGSR
jgi:endonuclease/exonuclease/phosphatase family metal-dependent hydrolase